METTQIRTTENVDQYLKEDEEPEDKEEEVEDLQEDIKDGERRGKHEKVPFDRPAQGSTTASKFGERISSA